MNEPTITIIGRVAKDPELRTSIGGTKWVTFTLAQTPRVKDKTGQWVDGETLWLSCKAFGELAENIAGSLTKGTRVIAQGRLSSRSYTDNQGQQRLSLDLDIDAIGPELRFNAVSVTGVGKPSSGGVNAPQTAAQGWGSGF